MAEFSSINTSMWREDIWFRNLPIDARLLFIYLSTNLSVSASGVYHLTLPTIAFESGIPEKRVKELLEQFAVDQKVFFDNGMVQIVNAHDHQLPERVKRRSMRPSASKWAQIRSIVFQRDDYTCQYCGAKGVRLECDHVIPVSRGGHSGLSNLVTACISCNRSKWAKTPEEWRPS